MTDRPAGVKNIWIVSLILRHTVFDVHHRIDSQSNQEHCNNCITAAHQQIESDVPLNLILCPFELKFFKYVIASNGYGSINN